MIDRFRSSTTTINLVFLSPGYPCLFLTSPCPPVSPDGLLIHLCVWLLLCGVVVPFDTFFFQAYHFSPNAQFSPQTIRAESTVGALHVFEYLRGSCSIKSNLVRGRRDERCFWMLAADKKKTKGVCMYLLLMMMMSESRLCILAMSYTHKRTKNCNMHHAYKQTNSEQTTNNKQQTNK